MEVKRMFNWIRPFAPLVILLMAGASIVALALVTRQPTLEATTERSATQMHTASEVREAKLPPIDAAAPTKTETATFAMG
jgi:hypothetical protein